MSFVLCIACERHVRESDSSCPFCREAAFRSLPQVQRPSARGRILAASVVAGLAATGCSEPDGRAVVDAGSDAIVEDATAESDADCGTDVADATPDAPDYDWDAAIPIYDAVPPIPRTAK